MDEQIMSDDHRDLEIAVVGMAGSFPMAEDVEKFWKNLGSGVESVVSLSHDELKAMGVPEVLLADPAYVRNAFKVT